MRFGLVGAQVRETFSGFGDPDAALDGFAIALAAVENSGAVG
ncbi:hypothetical protein OIE68_45710 [Nocardia vinacea]|nr:hypothetical protein OIE68_45710 [Nocardia vinacea]